MKYHEAAVGESSEWRTPASIFDALRLKFDLDPCGPEDGFCCVPAKRIYTRHNNGLLPPWRGLVFANPPWSERRRAVVPWLRRFFAHPDGGIFLCVARTSADWFQDVVTSRASRITKLRSPPTTPPANVGPAPPLPCGRGRG